MLKKYLFIVFVFSFYLTNAQLTVNVDGLKESDSIVVIVKKGAEQLFKKYAKYSNGETASVDFTLDSGEWAVKLDATGYTYASQQVINIPSITSVSFTLTEATEGDYTYNWVDDGSAAGHSTQSYIAEPTEIIVLNDTVNVPTDFSSIKLRTEYGIVLSDSIKPWTNEDSYRLYKMFSNLPYDPFGEGNTVDFSTGENVRGVFMLTDLELSDDITINNSGEIPYATVSQSAFTYANPQIVKLDGIRGKFYSKRLYHTVVNFITDFGNKEEVLNWLARESFGIQFVKPSEFSEVFGEENGTFMGDDKSNFQDYYNTEKLEILSMFEELPEGFHKQEGLQYLVRRIDGQEHPDPTYKPAAAIAWTGLKTIEFMSKGFIGGNLSETRRLILHEKAHFLWQYTFDNTTKDDWTELGGWFEDPTSASGWSTYNTTEFVSAYAHAKNPNEDMAESIAIYLTNPDRLINVSQAKYEFIRDRIMHGTRYVSIIREDLTFTVYNLYPDYTFPGKIVELDLKVEGDSDVDKKVTMKIRLNSTDPAIDGATKATARFTSSIGTIFDIGFSPVNGSIDSVLVGSASVSKFAKSGYWNLSSLRTEDQVGNARYENTSTVGAKLFISNPLEDITPPKFLDYAITRIDSTFNANGNIDANGEPGQAIKVNSTWEEQLNLRGNGAVVRIDFPNPEQAETYYKEAETYTKNINDTIKKLEGYFFIKDFYPSGYYAVTSMYTGDEAGNSSSVNFSNNPDNAGFVNNINSFAALKDSVYVETKYPDIVKPEIDLNNISVVAEPTNPQAPNGETRVDINFNARDLSDFPGYEAGVYKVDLTLRDPQGKKFSYQTGNSTMNHPELDIWDFEPVLDNKWRNYRFDLVLPQGSAAGVWGISDIVIVDKVGNTKSYNFEEYVRFDIIESDIELEEPLEIEITDKVINAGNVDAIKAKMSCKPCAGLNYVATIYSRFGGGAVVRNEGTLSADEVIVEDLNTTGILDGEVNLTVQLTDTENRLVATKTTAYTKDVVYPSAYYTRSNLQNDGTSSLDYFIVDVVIETQDVGGAYNLDINTDGDSSKSSNATSLNFTGDLVSEETSLNNLDLSTLVDGVYKFDLTITDPNGNVGEPETLYYLIEDNKITLLGATNTLSTLNNTLAQLTMYPNPVNHFYYIETTEEVLLEIFDIHGKLLITKKLVTGKNSVNTNTLAAGYYFFKIANSKEQVIKKILKK
ncbi:MAG: T9SS type A sorting domain-containing protein [Polaribacter sp.]